MAEEPAYDYGAFVEEPKGDGDLNILANLAEQQKHHQDEVERLQRELKAAQGKLADVAERKIPELMEKVGMEKFSTRNGLNISIRETIRASMGAGDAKEKNLDWLEQHGHGVIIKLGVEVPFGRGVEQQKEARELAERLQAEGVDASFMRKVEPATLSSLIRELLEGGQDVPEEQFGVFRQRIAKIS